MKNFPFWSPFNLYPVRLHPLCPLVFNYHTMGRLWLSILSMPPEPCQSLYMSWPGLIFQKESLRTYMNQISSAVPPLMFPVDRYLIVTVDNLLHCPLQHQFGITCKLTNHATDILIQIINIDDKQQSTAHWSLLHITGQRPPIWKSTLYYYPLPPTANPSLYSIG